MSFAWAKRLRWGLCARMTAYSSAAISVILLAAFCWCAYNLRDILQVRNDIYLRQQLIRFLLLAASDVRQAPQAPAWDEVRRDAERKKDLGLLVVIRHGTQFAYFPDNGTARTFAQSAGSSVLSELPQTIDLTGSGFNVRAMRSVISQPDGNDWTLDLGLRLAETEQTVAQFNRRLAIGGLLFLTIAGLGGFGLARQALRPVAGAVEAAQRLNPNDLSARLPSTGTGDELDKLAMTVNKLLGRLAAYHEQIIRFTADASHELRGPLAALRTGVEVALHQPRSAQEYQGFLGTIGEQCQHLTELVNDLLLLARADAGQVELRRVPVDLGALVVEAVETYRPLADEKQVTLELVSSPSAVCCGDPMRLSQVVMNLLDNAIKFTPPAGVVRLSLDADTTTANLAVEDSGPGIAADRLPHIFDRFYQIDDARSEPGCGLGLSICRWVVNAHQGSIDVTSQLGQGTCFRVSLPRQESSRDKHLSLTIPLLP